MNFRKANISDLSAISNIYDRIHNADEKNVINVGWKRNIYPTANTAEDALRRNDLFVVEDKHVIGSAIINHCQVDVYEGANWTYTPDDSQIMVMHTLAIDPLCSRRGAGKAFVDFYESYSKSCGCDYLRIDTQEQNTIARNLYKKCGFNEIGIVPCTFNGIEKVKLVLLEKNLL